ncbi:MAG: ABC transporter substrate-binding protein [Spirochaetales bacterium]
MIVKKLNLKKAVAIFAMGIVVLPGATAMGSKDEGNATDTKLKIGIAKIVQHDALDAVEQGIIDVVNEAGFDVEYNLQNANGDVNTAAQIANMYKTANVDVAVAIATPIAVAFANVLVDTPIVFGTVTDPIDAGLVSSLEHGEGNITGMSDAIPTKEHIKMFKDIAGIQTLGYIYSANEANSISALTLVEEGCAEAGINLVVQSITGSAEVQQAAQAIVGRVDGVYLTTDNTVFSALPALIQVFENAKKPVFSADVTGAMNGGCMIASGFNYYKAGRATGEQVVQILNGTNPKDIPIRFMTEPSDLDLLFDLDVAALCGISIPQEYLNQANMIFENNMLTQK